MLAFLSGSEMRPPSLMDFWLLSMAASMTLLPAVLATVSRPWRIGTPDLIRVPSVRLNLAMATFLSRMPNTGSFSEISSNFHWPFSVFSQRLKAHPPPKKIGSM